MLDNIVSYFVPVENPILAALFVVIAFFVSWIISEVFKKPLLHLTILVVSVPVILSLLYTILLPISGGDPYQSTMNKSLQNLCIPALWVAILNTLVACIGAIFKYFYPSEKKKKTLTINLKSGRYHYE